MYEIPIQLWKYIAEFDVRLACELYPKIKPTMYNHQLANYCVLYNIPDVLQYLLNTFNIPNNEIEYLYESSIRAINNKVCYYDTECIEILMPLVDINSRELYEVFIESITYGNTYLIDMFLDHNIKITHEALETSSWYLNESWHTALKNRAYGFS